MTPGSSAVRGTIAELRATEVYVQTLCDRLALAIDARSTVDGAEQPAATELARGRRSRQLKALRTAGFQVCGACGTLQDLIRPVLYRIDPQLAVLADDAAQIARQRALTEVA